MITGPNFLAIIGRAIVARRKELKDAFSAVSEAFAGDGTQIFVLAFRYRRELADLEKAESELRQLAYADARGQVRAQ